jgi:hypothetical protein
VTAIIKVTEVCPRRPFLLRLSFSDGREGIGDLSDLLAEGGTMVAPLRDPALFDRVFLQSGVVSWPNGFDLDSIALHREMDEAGLLTPPLAA